LIGKWFHVELQAEGVLTEEQGCLWGQHFEEKVLKRTSEVKMRCPKMKGHRFTAHQHSTEFRESMHSNCTCTFGTFLVYVKNEGGCGMNSKFKSPAWMCRTYVPTWYLVWNSNGGKILSHKKDSQCSKFGAQSKVFPTTSKHKYNHGINATGNSSRHDCLKAQL
jgi:hypothetical protein